MTIKRKTKPSQGRQPTPVKAWLALEGTLADDVPELTAADPTVWVEVTCEGMYRGYPGGGFKFDNSVFADLIKNFRAHPSFVAGPDGYGMADVVPWDFNHASEYPATDGSLPIIGAPAQGWIQDIEVRTDKNGKTGLFAKTKWLEPARTYIKEKRYKWASVTVIFDARDPVTNEKVGSVLTSVALTNTPFVEGMEELVAASRQVNAGMYVGGMYVEPACSPEDAFEKLRSLFALPATAAASDLLSQLARLQEWAASGTAPMGIDVAELTGGVRGILNLPALSSTEEVFAEVQKLLSRLLEEQAIRDAGATPPLAPPPPAPAPVATSRSGDPMSFKLLASKLGVQENEAACVAAVESLVTLRTALCTKLSLDPNVSDTKLLEAGDKVGDVRGKLGAILAALGLKPEEADAAIEKIAKQMEDAKKLSEVMPELSELKAKVEAAEAKEGEAEVEAALASRGHAGDEAMKLAFTALRKQDTAKFREKFLPAPGAAPAASGAAAPAHLTRSLAAKPGGAEHRVHVDPATGAVHLSPPSRAGTPPTGSTGTRPKISLSGLSGRNRTERMIAYLRAHGDDKLSFDELFTKACEALRTSDVVDEAG